MLKLRVSIALMAFAVATLLGAQEKTPATPGFDAQTCQEMAATHQKMMDAHKSMMEKQDAARKDIQTQLDVAKKAHGDKKVAALETVIEKLLAFDESMQMAMASSPSMRGGMTHGGMMGCCGEAGMGMAMAGTGMDMDCPMMKGMAAHPEPSTKSPN
jgi:hypothetical protein